MANHFGFLDSQEDELNKIGLEIYDVSPGRYLEIDLNIDRKEPQRVYPFGRFDTITVLNPQEIIDHDIWIYINRPYLENRYPLNQISRMETKGNEIYLQHEKINAKLKLLVGGDARAFKVDPINKDNSVTDLGLLNNKAKNIQDYTEILKENSETVTANIGQINAKQNTIIQNLKDIKENLEWFDEAKWDTLLNDNLDTINGRLNAILNQIYIILGVQETLIDTIDNLIDLFESGLAKVQFEQPIQTTKHNEIKGLSTLTKPLDVDDLTTYLEMDTGNMYYFHEGNWYLFGAGE